jgi:hypothetical protein
VILYGLDELSPQVEGSGSLDSPKGYSLPPQAGLQATQADMLGLRTPRAMIMALKMNLPGHQAPRYGDPPGPPIDKLVRMKA